ncbi:MAG: hypothetical protein ABJA02_13305 [Acidobacteriota bacterium]
MKFIKHITIAAMFIVSLAFTAMAQNPQADAASKTAKFGSVKAADASFTGAIDAHDLKSAAGMVGKTGAFKGTITKLFSPKGGSLVIINFDRDYKTALTAVVKKSNFAKFPDLSTLEGKKVLITGKFTSFHDATEIDLTDPADIKIVE